jgi:hypothetical protein
MKSAQNYMKESRLYNAMLQNPSKTNGDNLNNVRHETRRTFRKKKRNYLKEKK